jgi:predicted phosphoribosyltransferase
LASPGQFRDRHEVCRVLAEKLKKYADRPNVIVLALPRGGMPVAHEVARALDKPVDVFVVRELGVLSYEELAMGAVATGGCTYSTISWTGLRIPDHVIHAVATREQRGLARRERLYRSGRHPPDVRDAVGGDHPPDQVKPLEFTAQWEAGEVP